MKKAIPILFAATMIFVITILPIYSFAQSNEGYLIVRIYESRDKGYNKIVVTENGKILEEIKLIPTYYKDLALQQIEINKVIDKYENSGYNLSMATSGGLPVGTAPGILVTTYLFKKE